MYKSISACLRQTLSQPYELEHDKTNTMTSAGIILGGGILRDLLNFFAENLTENDPMGGKISPKCGKVIH